MKSVFIDTIGDILETVLAATKNEVVQVVTVNEGYKSSTVGPPEFPLHREIHREQNNMNSKIKKLVTYHLRTKKVALYSTTNRLNEIAFH